MDIQEKKEAWRLLGRAVDEAGDAGVPAEVFLTRAALLFALEVSTLQRVRELVELAHEAGAASAREVADIRVELAKAW